MSLGRILKKNGSETHVVILLYTIDLVILDV